MARPDATEKPTPKRKREARERGQVARSQDIGGSAIFLAIIIALHVGFLAAIDAGAQAFMVALTHAGSHDELTIRSVGGLFARSAMPYAPLLGDGVRLGAGAGGGGEHAAVRHPVLAAA